jgi:hypothetical protein
MRRDVRMPRKAWMLEVVDASGQYICALDYLYLSRDCRLLGSKKCFRECRAEDRE